MIVNERAYAAAYDAYEEQLFAAVLLAASIAGASTLQCERIHDTILIFTDTEEIAKNMLQLVARYMGRPS